MSRPAKSAATIRMEGKSHRTKSEMRTREQAEAALSTGCAFRVRKEVREDPVAYKEFKRVSKLLDLIGKNDALIEGAINRYCELTSEILEFLKKRELFSEGIKELQEAYEADMEEHPCLDDRVIPTMDYFKTLSKMESSIVGLDRQIMAKRKMLLDLEKENIMTIAAQLRSIPKKPSEEENEDPMAALFKQRGLG